MKYNPHLGLHRVYFKSIFSHLIDTIVWDGESGRIEGNDEEGKRFAFDFKLNGTSVLLTTTTPTHSPDAFPTLLEGCHQALFDKLFAA